MRDCHLEPSSKSSVTTCVQALVAVPDSVDDVAASQYYVNPLTAMGLVEVLPLAASQCLTVARGKKMVDAY